MLECEVVGNNMKTIVCVILTLSLEACITDLIAFNHRFFTGEGESGREWRELVNEGEEGRERS